MRATDHAQDASLRPASSIRESAAAFNAGEDMVSVHGVAHRVAPDEEISIQIFSRRIRHDEPITVAMRNQPAGQLVDLRPHRAGKITTWLRIPLRSPLLVRGVLRRALRSLFGAALRGLLFRGQGDPAVRVLVDFAALFHFSRKFHQRAPPGVLEAKRSRDFAKALRFAGARQMRQDIGFGQMRARLIVVRHGPGHCMRSVIKTRSVERKSGWRPD